MLCVKIMVSAEYKRAKVPLAALDFVFARKRYLQLAVRHGMAINLEARDLRESYEKGQFPKEGWEKEALDGAAEAAMQVQGHLISSFLFILLGALVAVSIGIFVGSLSIQLPIDAAGVIAFGGTFLVGWATLMELGGGFRTWSGEALHELIHPFLFKVLFVPGVALLFVSLLL
jgi:hypothetical protein